QAPPFLHRRPARARDGRPARRRHDRGERVRPAGGGGNAGRARPARPPPARRRDTRAHPRACGRRSRRCLWTPAAGAPCNRSAMATREFDGRSEIEEFPAAWQRVITDPLGFFADMPETGGLRQPTMFLAICAAVNALGHLLFLAGLRGMIAIFLWQV